MKIRIYFLLVIALSFHSCRTASNKSESAENAQPIAGKKTVRYGMITGVKPEKLDYYKQLHAHPWPAVLAKIKECNIENYSIYVQKIEDNYYLFSYFEYAGDDFEADMNKMAADTATQRWWKETTPCQLPLPEALDKRQTWLKMDELFHAL